MSVETAIETDSSVNSFASFVPAYKLRQKKLNLFPYPCAMSLYMKQVIHLPTFLRIVNALNGPAA